MSANPATVPHAPGKAMNAAGASTAATISHRSRRGATPVRRKIVLRGVHFDFDKSNIRSDARPILDEAIHILKDEPEIRVSVEGHTDSMGTEAYNQRLSERRARSVVDYLVAGGISRSRLDPVGFGESDPVASNATEEGRAQNRRVELKVLN